MQTVTTDPQQQPLRRAKPISGGAAGRFTWTVYSAEYEFFFRISVNGDAIFTSDPDYGTAPKAERAAKEWCEEPTNALASAAPPEGVLVEDLTDPPTEEAIPPVEVAAIEAVINGWNLVISDDRGGAYKADLVDAETGEVAPEDFRGYSKRDFAVLAASTWAEQHPAPTLVTDADPAPGHFIHDEGPDPQDDVSSDLDAGAGDPPTTGESSDEAPSEVPAAATQPATQPPRDAELEQLRAERDLARKERDAVLARVAEDIDAVRMEAEQCLTLSRRRLQILDELDTLKDELKYIDTKLRNTTTTTMVAVTRIGQGWQQRLIFAKSPETRAVVGHAAEKVAQSLGASTPAGDTPAEVATWAFNGVTYEVERQVEHTDDGERWTTWLKGHKGSTEEHGFTFEQALEATQNAASVVFADADPGSTTSSADTGPVADGPRRSKKEPKLRGKSREDVITTLRDTAEFVEAAMTIGCTPQQLQAFCEKNEIPFASPDKSAAAAEPATAKKTAKKKTTRGKRGAK